MEALGLAPRLVRGSPANLKVTYPEDLALAAAILAAQAAEETPDDDAHRQRLRRARAGRGTAARPGRRHDSASTAGSPGHSDADVLLHAISDALLGALALGDIGAHFPDTDARWKGADSRVLLRHVAALVGARGYEIGNVDATVIAQAPKLAPHVARCARTSPPTSAAPSRTSR